VPCTPPFVAGVMNLRGQILAIIDLRKFFELPARGLTELNRVIVLRDSDNELGLLADSVDGVRTLTASDLEEGLPTLTGIRERFLQGITGQMLAVLDGGRLLADAGLKVDEQVTR
jgi:purine-binding chemotaxis protein CheW